MASRKAQTHTQQQQIHNPTASPFPHSAAGILKPAQQS